VLVASNTVVGLRTELYDAQGERLSAPSEITYLHGGYGSLLDALERALEGKRAGESVRLQLEPEQAFGEYDASLVRLEPVEQGGARRQSSARRHGAALRPRHRFDQAGHGGGNRAGQGR
jgi:FKBP-type peptidyl-prolyl cis-trans isomerase 2